MDPHPRSQTDAVAKDGSANLPTVSLIVLNYNGQQHLAECLPSLTQLEYPADRLELMVVDNASSDGSIEFVRANYPQIRLVQNPENVGFGTGNNLGARAATGQYVIFLNNDMWVEPGFVAALVAAVCSRPEVASAGAKILNWDGSRFDYAGSGAHFSAHAFQAGFGLPYDPHRFNELQPTLFACAGAMIIDRQVFLDVGGFDDDYFIYFEDVDLGWRLWLLGHQVVYTPQAVVYHRHHGTMVNFSDHRKQLLYKRNAFYTILKNYDDENLGRFLPATLLGTVEGVVESTLRHGHLDLADFFIKSRANSAGSIAVDKLDMSSLVAIHEVVQRLPQVMEKRRFVQSRRRRADAEIAPLFRRPFLYWPDVSPQTQSVVADAFDLQPLFAKLPRRVLVISSDILPLPGLPTVGAGLRAWGLGQGLLACGHEVTYSMPRAALAGREALISPEVAALAWEPGTLLQIIRQADPDVVVACNWPTLDVLPAELLGMPIVLDQHGPHLLEREFQGFGDQADNVRRKLSALGKADFFLCAGQKQLNYFQSWLERAGWTEQERCERAAAPLVSLSPELPEHRPEGELTFVYGGVFLPWQDPSLALSTLVETLDRRGRGQLYLYGGKHPFIPIDSGVFDRLVERLAQSPRVAQRGMVSHADLIADYARAHVAIDVMQRNAERELAFTTRTVEYLWCGLPVIYNDYSELTDYIRRYEAGWIVDPADQASIQAALDDIFDHPEKIAERSHNAQRLVRECLTWERTIKPLDEFVRHPRLRPHPRPAARTVVRNAPYLLRTAWGVYRQRGLAAVWQHGRAFVKRTL